MLDKNAEHGGSDGDSLVGTKEEAAVGGELLVSGNAAEEDAEVDAGWDAVAFVDTGGDKADVVGVGNGGDGSSVVEGDVELAWEIEEVARVSDVGLHGLCKGGDIDELVWVE